MISCLKKNKITLAAIFSIIVLICSYAGFVKAGAYQVPLQHPDEGEELQNCMQCHDAGDPEFPYQRFDHTPQFTDHHGAAASQDKAVCNMCHAGRFCADCHGVGVPLKPSAKQYNATRQNMPHRGDYLSRHRIDGRIDPTSCFRCHGSPRTQRSCNSCHG